MRRAGTGNALGIMDALFQNAALFIGVGLCLAAFAQLSLWTASVVWQFRASGACYRHSMQTLAEQLRALSPQRESEKAAAASWKGLRKFRVDRLVREAEDITSIYLVPEDGKPLPEYFPGQFLTFQVHLPDQPRPLVRCYSLSDAPGKGFYRCTIKRMAAEVEDPSLPPSKMSSFFNDRLQQGDVLDVKAPSGGFYVDLHSEQPVVLLAGGIGITPLLSMINTIAEKQPDRKVVLFYGVRNSSAHAFNRELKDQLRKHSNLHVVICYSDPLSTDVAGRDYQVAGHVTPKLLAKVLPSRSFAFYLCGPPPFMESLYSGLIGWGVSKEAMHYESFGPATVKRARQVVSAKTSNLSDGKEITFLQSGQKVAWTDQHESLLELAEAAGVSLESGCRSGNCGTCANRVSSGSFDYTKKIGQEPGANECLVCVARPTSDMTIDA